MMMTFVMNCLLLALQPRHTTNDDKLTNGHKANDEGKKCFKNKYIHMQF